MILKGSQRSGGMQLAHHLLKTKDNEHVEIHELKGFVADDLLGAFKEVHAVSTGTKCKQFLFSLSLSPPERENVPVEVFEKAIAEIENKMGLADQPRAIVFHEKEGRRHAHCVWSRIDVEKMKAINLPHFKLKLRDISRQLYLENKWQMPRGLMNSQERNPLNFTQAEWQQAGRTKQDPRALKEVFQDCWALSDSAPAFANALKERGFYLATFDADGVEIGVIFETATPFETPRQMEELVRWARKAIDEQSMHPLLIVAVFIVQFLAIHPFQDGNGRLSRVLTTLMLLRAGYAYVPYASLESVIEKNKDIYYKSLRRTQTTLKGKDPDWSPWVGFFLRCLKKQKDNLVIRLDREKGQIDDTDLPEISVQILGLFDSHDRLNLSKITELSGGNKNTIKVRLRELVSAGHITKHGKARATWYVKAQH